jgi:hypothetical protein
MTEASPIICKINVTKIDKARLFKGEKGTYLDIALVPTSNSTYGDDFMVVQSVTKEEREQGKNGNIIGNARFVKKSGKTKAPTPAIPKESDDSGFDSDIPPF